MATQTGSYDLKAAKAAHDEAAQTASSYITEFGSDGIMVHAEGDGPDDTQTPSGWHLGGVLEYIKAGISRFWIGLKNSGDSSPTVRIGKEYANGASDNESRVEIDYHSMQMMDRENGTYFWVSDLRGTDGIAELTFRVEMNGDDDYIELEPQATDTDYSVTVSDGSGGSISKHKSIVYFGTAPTSGAVVTVVYDTDSRYAKALTFGGRDDSVADAGAMSVVMGGGCQASAPYSVAMGNGNWAEGKYSVATGNACHAAWSSFAAGNRSDAGGAASAAFGYECEANGEMSFACGYEAKANGRKSLAGGMYAQADGDDSAAFGYGVKTATTPFGGMSGAMAIGRYNNPNSGNAFEIGKGSSDTARANAFEVDWYGDVKAQGHYYAEGLKVGHSWCYVSGITATTLGAQNAETKLKVTGINQVKPSGAFTYNSSDYSITANVAGWYDVSVQVSCTTATDNHLMGIGVKRVRSGTSVDVAGPEFNRMRGAYDRIALLPTPVYLEANDKLYVYGRNNSAAGGTVNTIRWMIRPLVG